MFKIAAVILKIQINQGISEIQSNSPITGDSYKGTPPVSRHQVMSHPYINPTILTSHNQTPLLTHFCPGGGGVLPSFYDRCAPRGLLNPDPI